MGKPELKKNKLTGGSSGDVSFMDFFMGKRGLSRKVGHTNSRRRSHKRMPLRGGSGSNKQHNKKNKQ